MIGILLAAGVGSRLRPLTDSSPKCLLPIGREGLLPRALRALETSGLSECVIVTGYLHTLIEEHVASLGLSMPVRFVHNRNYETTNNNASLWLAGTVVHHADVLVLDSDILFDPALLPLLISSPSPDGLLVREEPALGPEEIKVIPNGGFVERIGKDVDASRATGESIGIEKFSADTARQLFAVLGRRRERNEFYEASFQEIIDNGARIAVVPTRGLPCMEVDTGEDLVAARRLALSLGL